MKCNTLDLLLVFPRTMTVIVFFTSWKWIFRVKLFSSLKPAWKTLFFAILLVIIVLFGGMSLTFRFKLLLIIIIHFHHFCIDSVRTMSKYGGDIIAIAGATVTLDAKLERNLRQCRGQRNFYITGFCLFLML